MPVRQYAVIENALRHAEGRSLEVHRNEVASLWSEMSRVAAENPDAWTRDFVRWDQIRDASAGNRMLAFPYTKLHNSQWNVDQAAGLIFTSAALARARAFPRASGSTRARWSSRTTCCRSCTAPSCTAAPRSGSRAGVPPSLRRCGSPSWPISSSIPLPVAVRVQQR
jgi:acetyl-CoA acetyltransferase